MLTILSKIAIPVIAIIIVLLYHLGTTSIIRPVESYLLVFPSAIVIVVSSILLIIQELCQILKKKRETEKAGMQKKPLLTRNQIILLAGIILYLVFMLVLGVKTATVMIVVSLLYLF